MPSTLDIPYVTTEDLPPYRGILAVDARGFTDQPGRLHQAISALIPQLVGEAFAAIGLADVWNEPAFFGPTGDGFAVGLPTRVMPHLVHPFLPELQRVLAAYNHRIRAAEPRMQLRVSLNLGPVKDAADLYLGGNGTARNDTHRLLDSVPVKAILAAASPNVTFVAGIISSRVYEDVVEQGYAGVHPDHLIEVPATVVGKPFQQRAWLYVPAMSGNLLGLHESAPRIPAVPPFPAKASGGDESSTVIHAPDNKGGVAGTVNGDLKWNTGERS